jgi:hypothetical protein
MPRWLVFVLAWLLGSFFGLGQVMGLARGMTARPAAGA